MAIYPEWVTTNTQPVDAAGPTTAETDDGATDAAATDDVAIVEEPDSEPIQIVDAPVPAPPGWNDPLTGTDGPHYWDRLVISEAARVRRYKRPTTVVFVEIAGLARLGQL